MTLVYGKVITRIADKHNATTAQVILARDLQLDQYDKKAIAALECNDRLVSPEGLAPDWD